MHTLWSVKGGSGVTVTATALAACAARRHGGALLVDLCGDLPAAVGLGEPSGPGIWDWLATDAGTPEALGRLSVPIDHGLALLPMGAREHPAGGERTVSPQRVDALVTALAGLGTTVVVDGGTAFVGSDCRARDLLVARLGSAGRSWMVIRTCYLALRRAASLEERPDGVLVVVDPGRALDRRDVEAVLSLPVRASIEVDPAVARAVDAGNLVRRPSRPLERSLRALW